MSTHTTDRGAEHPSELWSVHDFTDDTRRALAHANTVSQRLGHRSVDTVHLLLAITELPDAPAGRALARLGVDRNALWQRVEAEARLASGGESRRALWLGHSGQWTTAAKRALEGALRAAQAQRNVAVTGTDLLRGLLSGGRGAVPRLLSGFGVRAERLDGLPSDGGSDARAVPTGGVSPAVPADPFDVHVRAAPRLRVRPRARGRHVPSSALATITLGNGRRSSGTGPKPVGPAG